MKRLETICFVTAAMLFVLPCGKAAACTNVLVTPGASADASSIVSYAADSHWLYGDLAFRKAGNWKDGATRPVYNWDEGNWIFDIPQPAHTYKTVGNMNEHQLIIGETTFGGVSQMYDLDGGGIDYGSLIYLALERARTAREAISVIVELADRYGYCSEGESFSIADKNEVWVMELIGRGKGRKGIVWVARRVPDGYICAHANQSRISTFPLDDPENCLYAQDVISLAREKGLYDGPDSEFSFCDTYNPLDFGGMRGCESRAWSAFNILCDGVFTYTDGNGAEVSRPASDFLPYAMGRDKGARFPLFVKPAKKVTVADVARVMRDHFEDTPMDMRNDIGAGGNQCPYRWRPMDFECEGETYCNERAIATQQTGWWMVAQSRGNLPDEIGALLWFGTDDAATSPLIPIYVSALERAPESLRQGNGSLHEYSATSSFWINNRVSNACYKMYNQMQPVVAKHISAWENKCYNNVTLMDSEALTLYKDGRGKTKAAKLLSDFSLGAADEIFREWVLLEQNLLLGFMDGNVKTFHEDGTFDLAWPGYSEHWKQAVVKDHGDVLRHTK
ncbi:MAG: C69 family dipeptidase [Bacteroidales bacterium]|nr:C69 family dipeptidase [Bacteroidales bacterium]